MNDRRFILRTPAIRERAAEYVASLPVSEDKPLDVVIQEHEELHNSEQRARMWAMLGDLSAQVEWPVNGRMAKLSRDDWKDIMTAGLERDQRVTQGIEGGFVILGRRTSRMSKRKMWELTELIKHFGDSRQVHWTDPKHYEWEVA